MRTNLPSSFAETTQLTFDKANMTFYSNRITDLKQKTMYNFCGGQVVGQADCNML